MMIGRPDGSGNVALVADRIDQDWTSSMVHLRGNVLAQISVKSAKTYTVLLADELDYDEISGEFSAGMNVRLAVQDRGR